MTGTRSPIRILAFSRFLTRMRGLARMFVSPFSERRFNDGLSMPTAEDLTPRSWFSVSCVLVSVLSWTVVAAGGTGNDRGRVLHQVQHGELAGRIDPQVDHP